MNSRAATLVIAPAKGLSSLNLREVWEFRELLYLFVWRDIKVRYRQTVLGAAWAVLQPFLTMVVFTLLFGRMVGIESDGAPYPVFVYAGLLPWTYFASAVSKAGTSLVANSSLITKVYFPRAVIPLSAALGGLVDLAIAAAIMGGMMVWYGFTPTWGGMALLPFLTLLTFMICAGGGFWLSALNVEYRDFQYIIPFMVQILMFLTPVIYPVTLVPEKLRWILALNPMGGVIQATRAAVIGHHPVDWSLLGISGGVTLILFMSGLFYFKRVERLFADVI